MRGRCEGEAAAFQAASKRSQTMSRAGVNGSVFFPPVSLMGVLLLPQAADHAKFTLHCARPEVNLAAISSLLDSVHGGGSQAQGIGGQHVISWFLSPGLWPLCAGFATPATDPK